MASELIKQFSPGDETGAPSFSAPVVLLPVAGKQIKAWLFDPTVENIIELRGITPITPAIGFTHHIHYFTPDNVTGAVVFGVSGKAIQTSEAPDANAFGTETSITTNVDSTSGEGTIISPAILIAAIANLTVGETFVLKVRRDAANAADTHTGRVYVTNIVVKST